MKWRGLIGVLIILFCAISCGSKGAEVSGELEQKPNPPKLNEQDITTKTPLPYQTFTGYVDAGCNVEVRGGAEPITVSSDPQDGSFCVVVQLKIGEVNHLEFYAVSPGGERSDPTAIDVTQDPSLEPRSENVALYKSAYAASVSTMECPDCTPDKAIDNNITTHWENSANFISESARISPQWWMVDLWGEFYIKTINLKWNGSSYARKFEVWYSLLDNPIEPHNEPGLLPGQDFVYWETIYSTNYNNNVEITLDGKYLLTRWIALVLYESNDPYPQDLYKYRLIEVEALGFPPGGNVPRDLGCE